MDKHRNIDARALALARRIAERIDAESSRDGVRKARRTCERWLRVLPASQHECVHEWLRILAHPWPDIRRVLLDPGARGKRLRQNMPFCGILSNRERWDIWRTFKDNESRAA